MGKPVLFKRVKDSKYNGGCVGGITVDVKKLVKVFGKPVPDRFGDTYGEIMFVCSSKKFGFAIYDYKVSKNPWKNKKWARLGLGGKRTKNTDKNKELFFNFLKENGVPVRDDY